MNALDDIEEEMKIQIKESNWANKKIKDLALRRIKFIKKNIGYPDWYNNATIMENYSANVCQSFIYNNLANRKFHGLTLIYSLQWDRSILKMHWRFRDIINSRNCVF